ncbi:conserved membrane protein of unknown function [Magnetospirillum sp. XM-1]|uniref:DUF2235 domain-containing protein n=1 Tax=Magnetospirillum sp. XM-1 TaxID=1663591 RepID=UPI00073DFC4B|nr:DUF2235 domain-containing protein [Magnetospirillum sp. XM-1]CUW37353.1 conserved membrane protein of unknown function [Magnetospirillum sp. XM-1]
MGRNIIVFADGTGNSAASTTKTNVWRLYQALDLTDGNQLAAFADGVGTSSFMPEKILGLGLGFGVKGNVLALYKFLCRNYRPGDKIYAFGFSRGAFTIRILNGLLAREGLVTYNESEVELWHNARAAYRRFRMAAFRRGGLATILGTVMGLLADATWWGARKASNLRSWAEVEQDTLSQDRGPGQVQVEFLGLWDTVSAYGLPIAELTRFVDTWIFPMSFSDTTLPDNVQYGRQALSLDDERETFHPIPWDEGGAARPTGRPLGGEKLLQVWFAGAHANVGGGYPDDGLAHVPLCWMIDQAANKGLRFMSSLVAGYRAVASECGPIYDSRGGGGVFYRYQPRDLHQLMKGARPLIDGSVFRRLANGNDRYAPLPLTMDADVLTTSGTAYPLTACPTFAVGNMPVATLTSDGRTAAAIPVPPIPDDRDQEMGDAVARTMTAVTKRQANDPQLGGAPAGTLFRRERDGTMNIVWWRRVVYFSTLGCFLTLLAYPLIGEAISSAIDSVRISLMNWLDLHHGDGRASNAADGIGWGLRWLFVMAQDVLPDAATLWLKSFANAPNTAGTLLLAGFALISHSRHLQMKIRDRVRVSWLSDQPPEHGHKELMSIAWGVFWLLLGVTILLRGGETISWVALSALILGTIVLARAFAPRRIERIDGIARFFRTNSLVGCISAFWSSQIFPFVFFLGLFIGLVVVPGPHVLFALRDATGQFCRASDGHAPDDFETRHFCWDAGVKAVSGRRYIITLTLPPDMDWFDQAIHTDPLGFPSEGVMHANIFKRHWGARWFQPIARIGESGNDEYVLEPEETELAAADGGVIRRVPKEFCPFEVIGDDLALQETKAHPRLTSRIVTYEIRARTSGRLYLYVNDAIGFPFVATNRFYANNKGSAKVSVAERF